VTIPSDPYSAKLGVWSSLVDAVAAVQPFALSGLDAVGLLQPLVAFHSPKVGSFPLQGGEGMIAMSWVPCYGCWCHVRGLLCSGSDPKGNAACSHKECSHVNKLYDGHL